MTLEAQTENVQINLAFKCIKKASKNLTEKAISFMTSVISERLYKTASKSLMKACLSVCYADVALPHRSHGVSVLSPRNTHTHTHTRALAKQQIPPPLSLRPRHTRLSLLLFNTEEGERKKTAETELCADRQSGPSRFLCVCVCESVCGSLSVCVCVFANKGRLYQGRGYGTSLKHTDALLGL